MDTKKNKTSLLGFFKNLHQLRCLAYIIPIIMMISLPSNLEKLRLSSGDLSEVTSSCMAEVSSESTKDSLYLLGHSLQSEIYHNLQKRNLNKLKVPTAILNIWKDEISSRLLMVSINTRVFYSLISRSIHRLNCVFLN